MTLSGIPYTVIALAVFGLVLIVGGYIVAEVVKVDNDMMLNSGLPYSHARYVTMNFLVLAFNSMGYLALFCAVLFLWMNANQQQSGEI